MNQVDLVKEWLVEEFPAASTLVMMDFGVDYITDISFNGRIIRVYKRQPLILVSNGKGRFYPFLSSLDPDLFVRLRELLVDE